MRPSRSSFATRRSNTAPALHTSMPMPMPLTIPMPMTPVSTTQSASAEPVIASNSLWMSGTALVNHRGDERFHLRTTTHHGRSYIAIALPNENPLLRISPLVPVSLTPCSSTASTSSAIAAVRLEKAMLADTQARPAPNFIRAMRNGARNHLSNGRDRQSSSSHVSDREFIAPAFTPVTTRAASSDSHFSIASVAAAATVKPGVSVAALAKLFITKRSRSNTSNSGRLGLSLGLGLGLSRAKQSCLAIWEFLPTLTSIKGCDAPIWRFKAVAQNSHETTWYRAPAEDDEAEFQLIAFEDVSCGCPRLIVHVAMEESAYHHLLGLWLTRLLDEAKCKATGDQGVS
ncbi:hypothetical protein HOO65_050670 [Ceratocystis lukuohia]|uniref:Uncharacterized protein n=1 Tax=Ceratocystis lukuohia TaxID=2019550 RepID=A0ABR4MGZ4_9PEZI